MKNKGLVCLAISVLAIALYGCGQTVKTSSDVDVSKELDNGKAEILNGNVSDAKTHYEKILTQDPNNPEANLMLCFLDYSSIADKAQTTEMVDYINQQYGSNIQITTNFNVNNFVTFNTMSVNPVMYSPVVGIMSVLAGQSITTANEISKSYEYIENVILPVVDSSINRLNRIAANKFSLNIKDMLPPSASAQIKDLSKYDIVIDNGEVYALMAYLNLMKAMICSVVAYDFSVSDINVYKNDPMSLFNIPTFGTLRRSGKNLTEMKSALLASGDAIKNGINFIQTDTSPQYNHIIRIAPVDQPQINSIISSINDLNDYLNGTKLVKLPMRGTPGIPLDLSRLFAGAVGDIKTLIKRDNNTLLKLESYSEDYDWTLNGLFPGMTKLMMQRWVDYQFMPVYFTVNSITTAGGQTIPYYPGISVTGNSVTLHGTTNADYMYTLYNDYLYYYYSVERIGGIYPITYTGFFNYTIYLNSSNTSYSTLFLASKGEPVKHVRDTAYMNENNVFCTVNIFRTS